LICLIVNSPLAAEFAVRPVNLTYLSRRADIIVQGQVLKVRHVPLPNYPNVTTVEVTMSVDRGLRGVKGSRYTFREVHVGFRSSEGKRSYRVGQRLFLFLPSPSQYGLSSPIGMGQGRFLIASDPTGISRLVNEHGNAGLFRDVEQDLARAGKKLTPSQRKIVSIKKGPVPLEEFVSLVQDLSTLPRIR